MDSSHDDLVAPLQITKQRRKPSTMTLGPTQPSYVKPSGIPKSRTKSGQITPPLTPAASYEDLASHGVTPMKFHNYLRAYYHFHPVYDSSSPTVTLPLNEGDIILVHTVHVNGWADGTLLGSGHRGWLPTNYCEAYDPAPIQHLMTSLVSFYDVIKGGASGLYAPFLNQDYSRGLIAGVRNLLVQTECLNREDRLIALQSGSADLRRNRKALLQELSGLVKNAKSLETRLKADQGPPMIHEEDLNSLVLKAFTMVLRAVKFLDIWTARMELEHAQMIESHLPHTQPPTPPAEQTTFASNQEEDMQTPQNLSRLSIDLDERQGRSIARRQRSQTPKSRRSLQATRAPSQLSRPASINTARHSLSHRISWSARATLGKNERLVSEKLSATHDAFLACLGNFLGIHLVSQSSNEVLVMTQQSVNAGRSFLTIVEAVWDRGQCRSEELEDLRNKMYLRIADLVHVAQTVFQPVAVLGDADFESQNRKQLKESAMECIRSASECLETSRQILEMVGDFEQEATENASAVDAENASSQEEISQIQSEDVMDVDSAPRESPPEPTAPPPLPPSEPPHLPQIDTGIESDEPMVSDVSSPTSSRLSNCSSFQPPPSLTDSVSSQSDCSPLSVSSQSTPCEPQTQIFQVPSRVESLAISGRLSGSTYVSSIAQEKQPWTPTFQDSHIDVMECTSDAESTAAPSESTPSESTMDHDGEEDEASLLEKTYAHELIFNKDGQITGGSLDALIERLTVHDVTPDALFVSTFYLTFRLFASPTCFARALIDRFEYVGHSSNIAAPVRLRVYNVFKGWLESHWRVDCDSPALELIIPFASGPLAAALPAAGKRLKELTAKVSATNAPLVPRLVSSIGKTNTSIASYVAPNAPMPASIVTKSQLSLLKAWRQGTAQPSILDFDPLELARQLTLKVSRIFCSILPEELLGCEWTKKAGSVAINVRAIVTLSTDLANLVAASVLRPEDHRTRAKTIKQWVKVSARCLELHNYDSLMAIVCALNGTTLLRLRRTWECVSARTKASLEALKRVVDCSKNYTMLRGRLAGLVPPCLPFVGIYLTDLTFVDAGNQATRLLPSASKCTTPTPSSASGRASPADTNTGTAVINFDKHVKTARIISELQRFQIPHRLHELPELQTWMQDQFVAVRSGADDGGESCLNRLYRRSCLLEPREQQSGPQAAIAAAAGAKVGLSLVPSRG